MARKTKEKKQTDKKKQAESKNIEVEEKNEETTDNQEVEEESGDQELGDSTEQEGENWEKKFNESNDKYLRLYSEFDNFRRRTAKERIELLQNAAGDMITAILPVLDDFDRAIKSNEEASDIEGVKEGFQLIRQRMKTLLDQKGLKDMEAIGNEFDTDLHEAITNIPAPSEDMKGKVVDVVEKGYYLNDKVLRFAKVVVGN